jgi:uncharacterized membrane protein
MSLYPLLKTAHVLAVVLWVGGMLFAHFFLRPSLAVLEPPQRLKLMHAVLGRFFAAVLWATALILLSGFAMIGLAAQQVADTGGHLIWPLDWSVMAGVGILMIAIFGHIRFVLANIRSWVGANLALGMALVALVEFF